MIPFVRAMEFEYGRTDQVSPLIRRVVAKNPGPFTFHGTGTYIVGRGEVAVIDPGPPLEEHLEAILRAVDGERVSHILITHTHADHSPLARPLGERTGGVILGLPAPGAASAEEAHEDAFRPDLPIVDGQRVEGPGWTVRAVFTPGHASNHVAYALEEENALFSGDHVMGWSTTVVSPPDGDMAAYYASLEKVRSGDFATLWPTHGPPVTEVEPFLIAYRRHRQERERQILGLLSTGPKRIADMVPLMYKGVDKRLHPAAARSVLAHLIQLGAEGAVVSDGPPTLESEYRLG